jgi:hypothetical protein
MPFYRTGIILPGAVHTETYGDLAASPEGAAKKALRYWEKDIAARIARASGREKRDLERIRIPRVLEVSDSSGKVVAKFSVNEIS